MPPNVDTLSIYPHLLIATFRRRVNELVCGKRVITPDTAVRLALHFGTDVAFWLELQFAWDLHEAQQMYYRQVKPNQKN